MKKVVFLFCEKDNHIPNEYSPAMTWWYGILEKMGYEVFYYDYSNFNFNDFYAEMKDFKPDFIIHAAYDKLHTEFVKLREICKTFVIQSDDDYRFNNFGVFWIPFVDGIISFCGGRKEMKEMYNKHGCMDEQFLHGYWSFNPNTMTSDGLSVRINKLSHAGSIYGNRQSIINQFSNLIEKVDVIHNVSYEIFKERVSKSFYTLCLTQSSANPNIRQLKGRIFELPYHSILLSEPFPDMETYYDLEKEIIIFNSVSEAIDKINNISPEKYNEIYKKGKQRLLSNHTAYHVWDRYILPKIDPDYKSVNVTNILKENHGIVI